jgi:alcohol dehydrogenase class IV
MDYRFELPTKLIIGEGCSKQLGENIKLTGAKRVMCVFDRGVENAGLVAPLLADMEAADLKVTPFNGVLPDPPMEVIEQCTALAREARPDAFVAVGGGSSIDTAKAVNANLSNPGTLRDHAINLNGLKVFPFDHPLKPFFALPTTAGTGSEVSPSAVVTDHEAKLKVSVMAPDLVPTMALIDPALTVGLPLNVTASTGLDAFAHALEGLMGGLAIFTPSPMRDSFAFTAIELVLESLLPAMKNGTDIKARTDMSYAAFMSILGAGGGLSMGHCLGHAMGEVCGIHNHGFLCASILPYNIAFMAELIPQKLHKLASVFKIDPAGKTIPEIGTELKAAIQSFYRACGVPALKDMGLKLSDTDEIIRHTTSGTWYLLASKKPSEEELARWIQAVYEGGHA